MIELQSQRIYSETITHSTSGTTTKGFPRGDAQGSIQIHTIATRKHHHYTLTMMRPGLWWCPLSFRACVALAFAALAAAPVLPASRVLSLQQLPAT